MRVKVILTSGAEHIIDCGNMVRNNYDGTLAFYGSDGLLIGLVETRDLSAWFEIPVED